MLNRHDEVRSHGLVRAHDVAIFHHRTVNIRVISGDYRWFTRVPEFLVRRFPFGVAIEFTTLAQGIESSRVDQSP
jgi:hypothetical protein